MWCMRVSRPTETRSLRASRSAFFAFGSFILIASATFSSAVSAGNRLKPWKMKPNVLARICGSARSGSRVTSWPPMKTVPEVGRISRPRIEISVVLPEPDGPSMRRISPGWTERSASESAVTSVSPSPKTFETRATLAMDVLVFMTSP